VKRLAYCSIERRRNLLQREKLSFLSADFAKQANLPGAFSAQANVKNGDKAIGSAVGMRSA
jgi:hypothetical protein